MHPIPSEVDLLVLGAGAGGMTAALSAAILGLDVALIEKAETVGGTTARSAGSVWVPNSRHDKTADTREQALRYLQGTVGNRLRSEMADAFLDNAPRMVDFLEAHSDVRFRAYAHHPDYAPGVGGSTTSGRVLEPVPFDARVLGRDFATLSAPLPEFTVFGGMMVDRTDIGHLLGATRSLGSFSHAARMLVRHGTDRLRHQRGTRLVMGNALAGRLFYSLKRRSVPVLTATQVIELIEDNGRITGARLQSGSGTAIVRCRRGVVLATGGLSRNPELRRRLLPGARRAFSRWPRARPATALLWQQRPAGISAPITPTTRSGRRSRCASGATAARPSSRISSSTGASPAPSPSTLRGSASSARPPTITPSSRPCWRQVPALAT